MNSYYRVFAEINLSAIANNVAQIRKNIASNVEVMAIIKADGYGHGAVPIAKTLVENGADRLGVAVIEEGIVLRKSGIEVPILILGYTSEHQYGYLVQYEITQTVFKYSMAEAISKIAMSLNKNAKIHIKVDTGMARIGFAPTQENADIIKKITELPNIEVEGIFSHFARADEGNTIYPSEQLDRFQEFILLLESMGINIPIKHISNSAAIIDYKDAQYDLVRPGLVIYGLYPSEEVNKKAINLEPALELKSHVIYLKEVPENTSIGYGGTFITSKTTKIATIPVGYGDGYPRALSSKGRVLIGGKFAPIIGRICMDQFMVDVTDFDELIEGAEVVLIGKQGENSISVEELAKLSNTINYEIICGLGKRIPRVYKQNGKIVRTIDCFE
ncbi:MAG: Alanine racemase [Clostridiales bacterium]|jgi:alanine racemase|nr:Alanine racemase [Clostridiales bacterium]